jgi:hypothetical protein
MYSRKELRRILSQYMPDDIWHVVDKYVPSPLPQYQIQLLPTGVNIITSRSPSELLQAVHTMIRMMIQHGSIPYMFSQDLSVFTEVLFNDSYINNRFDAQDILEIMRDIEQSQLEHRTSLFMYHPPPNFLRSSAMQRLLIHSACMRLPVFICCEHCNRLPPCYRQYVRGIISQNKTDVRYMGRLKGIYEDMAIDVLNKKEFYVHRHPAPVKCDLGVDGLSSGGKPYQGRLLVESAEII